MQLGVREVAHLFEVAEKTVYRWVQEDDLPAYEVEGQHRFHRAEVLEWATAHDLTPSPEIFEEDASAPETSIARALERGGVYHDVPASDVATALEAIIARLPIAAAKDRSLVLEVLRARRRIGKTDFGGGIAIPHVRHPLVLDVAQASVVLCFLERTIDFDASGNGDKLEFAPRLGVEPAERALSSIHTLFFLITPSVRTHLTMLSRLAFLLHEAEPRTVLERRASAPEIVAAFTNTEVKLQGAKAGGTTATA